MSQYVVFDTNVVVSALLFRHGKLSWLREFWRSERAVALVSRDTTAELMRVLAYPKFRLNSGDIETLLSDYLPFAEVVTQFPVVQGTPVCRDADDQIFIDLALAGGSKYLVTGDSDLLSMVDICPFAIIQPAEFKVLTMDGI